MIHIFQGTRGVSIHFGIVVAALTFAASTDGGEIRLKNGTVLTGNVWLLDKLSGTPVVMGKFLVPKDVDPNPRNIVMIDNGWQKYYVPRRQIPDPPPGQPEAIPTRPQAFEFKVLGKKNQQQVIAAVGSVLDVTPFNEHGQRTITLASAQKKLDVIQVISRIEPDHVILDSTNFNWQVGISLKAVPKETVKEMLRKKVKADDPAARFALVTFYNQAEMYPQAFEELEGIAAAFPDQRQRVNVFRTQLIDYFGSQVLQELNRRKAAGQHQLAYVYAQSLTKPLQIFPGFTGQQLTGAVMADVRKFVQNYDEGIKNIGRVKSLLVEWQAKLNDPELVRKLQPLRSEINDHLDLESLPRLDAFLQSEADANLSPDQHLALAYSGWVVGAANSITSLDLAIRYWDARFAILESLRAESVQERETRTQELRRVEGVGPKVVLQIASMIPPFLDAQDIVPGKAHRVLVTSEGQLPAIAYSVILPPEYSPNHNYPLLIALRSQDRTNEQTLQWWGGEGIEDNLQGPSMRRGYILIVPEYLEPRQTEYTYSAAAHNVVIESLRDARKRFSVDSNRVYLAGHGIGADAAFDMGMSHPDEFAGVIPIGGDCAQYPRYTYMNGRHTAWYVIGRGFNDPNSPQAQRDPSNNAIFDKMLVQGFQFDFLLVEYLGRGLDRYLDEVPKLFDWMDLEVRKPMPKDFDMFTLRKTDNRFFWATALDLPQTTILPPPEGMAAPVKAMHMNVTITAGNVIQLKSSRASRYVLRFSPDSIDYEKRIDVRDNKDKRLWTGFVTPDSKAIVDELRSTGDRTRLPLATMEF